MGTLPVLSQYHLTGSFRLFQKEHPEISLALTEVEESELMEGIEKKLSNPGFLSKAPENVVNGEKEKAEKLRAMIAQLEEPKKRLQR